MEESELPGFEWSVAVGDVYVLRSDGAQAPPVLFLFCSDSTDGLHPIVRVLTSTTLVHSGAAQAARFCGVEPEGWFDRSACALPLR